MCDAVDSELELSVGVVASNFDFRVKDDSFVTLILHYLLQINIVKYIIPRPLQSLAEADC